MTVRSRKPTSTKPIETHEHVPESRAIPAVSAESAVPYSRLRTRVGIGLFAAATVVLFGISLPLTPLPSSLAALAALVLALGMFLVSTATTGRGEAESTVQASPPCDDETRVK